MTYSALNIGVILISGIWVRGGSGSLKMVSIDRLFTTYYWPAVVLTIVVFHHFWLKNTLTLKSGLGVTRDHWKWHHSIDRTHVPIRLPLQLNYGHLLYRFRNKA